MTEPELEPRLLRTFVAVAEELHFGHAADRLHLAQAAVSGHVKRLEDGLGVRLLERTSRRVELTQAGAVLLDHARRLQDATAAAVAETRRADRGSAGTLEVGLTAAIARDLVQPALDAFAQVRPDVVVTLRESVWSDPSGGLADGSVDVALIRPPIGAAGVALEPLLEEPRAAVIPAGHALADKAVLRIEDLLHEPWAGSDTDPVWRAFWTAEAERGAPARYATSISSLDGLFDAVRHSGAVGLVPASAADRFAGVPGITFRPVDGIAPSQVAVGWHPASEDPRVRAFVALVRRVLAGG